VIERQLGRSGWSYGDPVVDSAVVCVGHLEIAYRVAGGPEARPLVLLHALGEDSGDWGEVIDALAPTRRVYAPDLRGHGRSSWPGLYSLELMRADVLSFLDALELPVVDMVGHSLGGVVAYLLAEEQPARVERLVLEEPAPPLPATPPRQVPSRTDGPLTFVLGRGGGAHCSAQRPRPRVVGPVAAHHGQHAGRRRRQRQPPTAKPARGPRCQNPWRASDHYRGRA